MRSNGGWIRFHNFLIKWLKPQQECESHWFDARYKLPDINEGEVLITTPMVFVASYDHKQEEWRIVHPGFTVKVSKVDFWTKITQPPIKVARLTPISDKDKDTGE